MKQSKEKKLGRQMRVFALIGVGDLPVSRQDWQTGLMSALSLPQMTLSK